MKLELPIKTVSEANSRDHWRTKNARKLAQQQEVKIGWLNAARRRPPILLWTPFIVRLTRIGPRTLDDDNLRSAFKGIRDEVARLLNVDDGNPRVKFMYGQEKRGREYGIRIEVEAVESLERVA